MIIELDFEGIVVEPQSIGMGRCNFGCMEVIGKLQRAKHEIRLNTSRAEDIARPQSLESALKLINEDHWMLLKDRDNMDGFSLEPITANKYKIHPPAWDLAEAIRTGVLFIDDMSWGIPLKPAVMTNGMMVDWSALDVLFEENGLYIPIT